MTDPIAASPHVHPHRPPPAGTRVSAEPAPVRRGFLLLAFGLVLMAAAALPGAADAACVCRCLDGKAKAICSSGTDIPPLCNNTSCPLSTPKRTPLDAREPAPPVKPGCTTRQVYNPDTGKHEWGQICQ